jgi:tetratricopeptide (TPR) repeat protein
LNNNGVAAAGFAYQFTVAEYARNLIEPTKESRSMRRQIIMAAIAAFAAVMLALPSAWAMDSKKVQQGGPDLTAVRAHIKKEEWKQALQLLEPLAKSHSNSADVRNLLGFTQRKTGRFDESLKNYLRALKLDPGHLEAHVYLGELYIQTGKLEKAIEHAKIIAKLCPPGCKPRAELEAAIAKAKW